MDKSINGQLADAGFDIVKRLGLDVPRFEKHLQAVAAGKSPYHRYPGISRKPFVEPDAYELTRNVAQILEDGYASIRSELEAFLRNDSKDWHFQRYSYRSRGAGSPRSLNDDGWSNLLLLDRCDFVNEGTRYFPQTTQLLQGIVPYMAPFGQAEFTALNAGGVIPPHRDVTNRQLTCQLAIIVPANCGIRVGGQRREWSEGKCLFFDHSYPHEVWNYSWETRFVLIVNVTHPELTPEENEAMGLFEREIERLGRPPLTRLQKVGKRMSKLWQLCLLTRHIGSPSFRERAYRSAMQYAGRKLNVGGKSA